MPNTDPDNPADPVGIQPHRRYPCAQCPWRADVDLAMFSDADMAKLARANGVTRDEASMDAPAMACHLDQPGSAHPMRLCAGWMAVVGQHHLGIRMAVIAGRLPAEALALRPDWPALRTSLSELLTDRRTRNTRGHR